MKIVVLDASIAAKWIFLEPGSEQAEKIMAKQDLFAVPDLFYLEMDAIIGKKFRKKELSNDEAHQKRELVRDISVEVVYHHILLDLAFDISISLPVSIYDALYIALAVEKQSELWTADDRLVRGLKTTIFSDYVKNPLN